MLSIELWTVGEFVVCSKTGLEVDDNEEEVEKFIIKSFFKSILTVKNNNDMLEEEKQLIGMKIIQILINHLKKDLEKCQ